MCNAYCKLFTQKYIMAYQDGPHNNINNVVSVPTDVYTMIKYLEQN